MNCHWIFCRSVRQLLKFLLQLHNQLNAQIYPCARVYVTVCVVQINKQLQMLLAFIQSNPKAHLLSFSSSDLEGNVLCLSSHLFSLLTSLTLSFRLSVFFSPLFCLFPPSPCAASSPANPSRLARPLFLGMSTIQLKCVDGDSRVLSWLLLPWHFPSDASAQCVAEPLLPSPHFKPSPKPAEKEALLAPGLQVHHTLPEQHLQQIL